MASLRTFVALELPDEAKTALATAQRDLLAVTRGRRLDVGHALKWVDPESIHLTLKFLGYVDETALADVMAAVDAAASGRPAARLRFGGLGCFPNPRQPRVIWAGMGGDIDVVQQLQKAVEDNLARLGFAPEGRPFAPHLTLARVREAASPAERRAVADLMAAGTGVAEVAFVADRVTLMKSDLHPTGARYTALHSVELVL